MKTNIFAQMKKNLTIPATSVKIAGLDGEDLEAHLGDGAIVLLREEMDAEQLIEAIEFLKDLATDLTVALACACGQCEECGDCYACDDEDGCPDDCARCKTPCHGVEIPACLLKDAGIDPEVGLQLDTRDGEIIIREIDDEWSDDEDELDITDYVPEGLLTVLRGSDVCLTNLRDLLESGEIVYG